MNVIKLMNLLLPRPVVAGGGAPAKTASHDAGSESHTGTTGSASEASFTWNHIPVGTPKGALVFVITFASATTKATSVTYGGTAMTAVVGGEASDAAGEPGNCKCYFLGSSVPTGTQAVVVNRTNDATVMYAVCVTQTANGDTEVTGIQLLQGDGVVSEVNVDDGRTDGSSVRYGGGYTGQGTPDVPGPNSTDVHTMDLAAAYSAHVVRETVEGFGSRPVGFNYISDDRAFVHLAVRQV